MRATFRIRISPDDVGRRVTVRYRLDAQEGQPGHSDAVGTLERWEGGLLRVRDRKGRVVEIAQDRVVAGRVVGPPPGRRGTPRPPGTQTAG